MVLQGSNHTTTPMARFAFRVTTASALSLAIVTAVPLVPSTAQAQETERPFGLLDRIFSGSERFGGGSERGASPSAGAEQTAQMSGSDLVVRLERLESQIRQLTGAIEQLQFRNQQLEAQVRRLQEGGATSGVQPRPVSPSVPSGPAATTAPGRRGDAFDPAQNPSAPGAPHTLGAVNAPGGRPPPIRATRRSVLRAGAWPMRHSISPIWGLPAVRPRDNRRVAPPPACPPRCRRRRRRATNTTSPTAMCCARTMRSPRTASATS